MDEKEIKKGRGCKKGTPWTEARRLAGHKNRKPISEEGRKSEAMKKFWLDIQEEDRPTGNPNFSWPKGKKQSEEHIAKRTEILRRPGRGLGKKISQESIEKRKATRLRNMMDPNYKPKYQKPINKTKKYNFVSHEDMTSHDMDKLNLIIVTESNKYCIFPLTNQMLKYNSNELSDYKMIFTGVQSVKNKMVSCAPTVFTPKNVYPYWSSLFNTKGEPAWVLNYEKDGTKHSMIWTGPMAERDEHNSKFEGIIDIYYERNDQLTS